MQANTTSRNDQKQKKYFITYGVSFISLGLAMASLGPMLPFLAENTGVSLAQISFLFTANGLGYLIGSAGGGRLYDHIKGHRLMIFALAMMIIISFLIPFASMFYILMALIFLLGLGLGLLDIGGNVNLLWVFQSKVGPYMNALHFTFGIGAFLSPIIVHNVMVLTGGSLTWPYWVLAILFLPSIIGLWILKSPENPEKEVSEQKGGSVDFRLVALMVILFFTYVGVEGGFGGWIFTYALEEGIAGEAAASYMNSIFWGALTLGRLLSIPLAKRLTPSKLLTGNFLLAIFFLGLILIWPKDSFVIWLGSAGLGLALSSVFPTLLALSETRMQITGKVTGSFFLGSSSGGLLIPMLLGQIFEYIGAYQIMLTLFGIACLGLIVLFSVIIASNRVGEKIRS